MLMLFRGIDIWVLGILGGWGFWTLQAGQATKTNKNNTHRQKQTHTHTDQQQKQVKKHMNNNQPPKYESSGNNNVYMTLLSRHFVAIVSW